jgi:hypothetical protein
VQHRVFTREIASADDPEEIRAGDSRSIVKDAGTVIFRIANETGEMQSPTFSLALRRCFPRVSSLEPSRG